MQPYQASSTLQLQQVLWLLLIQCLSLPVGLLTHAQYPWLPILSGLGFMVALEFGTFPARFLASTMSLLRDDQGRIEGQVTLTN